ncbi:MAG: hypothetical protein ISQ14_03005 [Verrucomicrobiae bacterium]|jgi:hypothetical protein|nr:hypothetical protein [Verrucomicrobiae bacterium]
MTADVSFGDRDYVIVLLALLLARALDFFSTWVATPNLVLEGNPIARKLGWRLGIVVNGGTCLVLAFWPLAGIIVVTTSLLVAARNFKSAWMMRSMGEDRYLVFMLNQMSVTPRSLLLVCLLGETLLMAAIGAALLAFSGVASVPFAIGAGFVAYAVAVLFYSCLSLWKAR